MVVGAPAQEFVRAQDSGLVGHVQHVCKISIC